MTQPNQIKAALALTIDVSEVIRDAGEIPAGKLYAALLDRVSLEGFNGIVRTLRNAQLVEEGPGHMLRWIGPSAEEAATRPPTREEANR